MEIQRIIRDYNENLFQKIGKPRRNGKFLYTYNHPKLNQDDINHLNRS
jgi:hypothetical protein